MCRTGGPRCTGKGRKGNGSGHAAATADPSPLVGDNPTIDRQDYAAAKSGGTVPTRERADQLANALPASRTGWDGKPLDDAGRRLYALRESGYKGPIDQDGYPDTSSNEAGILRHMAEQRGETVDW